MTNRVRLTQAAATRFPDLAGRTGTVLGTDAGWARVMWDGHGCAWMPTTDIEPAPEGVGMTTTPAPPPSAP